MSVYRAIRPRSRVNDAVIGAHEEVLLLLADPGALLTPEARPKMLSWLAPADREHASRFHSERDREVALASRVVQRLALSLATRDDVPPAAWHFIVDANGRPGLRSPPKVWSDLRFSAANTVGLVGCAVRQGYSVGLDLEPRRETLPAELVDRCLSDSERTELDTLAERDRSERFVQLWTAKEAYLKARGVGIVDELDQVEVTIGPGLDATLTLGRVFGDDGSRWQLALLRPTLEHCGALCFERVKGRASPSIKQRWVPAAAE